MIISDKTLPEGKGIREMCAAVQRETDSFGLFLDLDRILEYIYYYKKVVKDECKIICKLTGLYDYVVTQREVTISLLLNTFEVPESLLTDPHKKTLSVAEGVIDKLTKVYGGSGRPIEEFLIHYKKANYAATMASNFASYAELPQCQGLDRDNHRMVVAHPKWNILSTSRMSASDPACQNINRDHSDIVTAPKGWQIVRADSGQIEPRIQWSYFTKDTLMSNLITAYDDAYYAYYDFVTMSEQRERMLREDFKANFKALEFTDEFKEGRQQMKRMSLAANYGSSLPADAGFDPTLAKLYTERIVNNPARLALANRIEDEVNHGRTSFEGAFGTPVIPRSTTKYTDDGGKAWREHLVRCGLNNPIQTTASELNCFAIFNCLSILQNFCVCGHLAYSKHDEGAVYLYEDTDMIYADMIADCWSYNIPGWIPIRSEKEVGRKKPHNDVACLL